MTHETECKDFYWAVKYGYIYQSKEYGSWCVLANGTDNDELTLSLKYCPYCGASILELTNNSKGEDDEIQSR